MADELVGGVLVVVHRPRPPAPSEWSAHCAGIVAERARIQSVIVLASGSGPNALQRDELEKSWGPGTPPPIAIMSGSTVIRGVLTALNWFMANRLKPFAPTNFAGAFDYLGLAEPARKEVLAALRRIAGELGVAVAA